MAAAAAAAVGGQQPSQPELPAPGLALDKAATAAHLKAALSRPDNRAGAEELQALLERVLSAERPLAAAAGGEDAAAAGGGGGPGAAEEEALEWCKCLLAGGGGYDEFCAAVRAYDPAALCGLVWTANFVAYRCRTCGISPCMSLCAECFHQGDHTGHDFNMFRSQAGGACDCGDSNVMRESGFCKRHQIKSSSNIPCVPKDLLMMSEFVLPRFIFCLIQYLREGYNEPAADGPSEKDLNKVLQLLEPQISFLEDLTKMGGAMRSVLTQVLTNQQNYKDLTSGLGENACVKKSHEKYLIALKSSGLTYPEDKLVYGVQEPSAGTSSLAVQDQSIMDVLKHKSFLEELLFWTIKYEFPQKMVTFLLNMLPDQEYKVAFTKTFVQHYAFIMKTLKKSHESDTMSNRIVHISVQLFSNEELARQVTEECQLLDIMVTVLLYMMESCLIKSELQGMNLNKRELNEHVEFESQTYYAAFAAELEACAQPMWGLLSHCKVRETQEYTRNVVRYCLEALQDWFDAINFVDEPAPNQVTFHLPLHRYYAMFLSKAVKCQELDLDSVLPDQEMLMKLMIHPLQIQASLAEIHSNMWVRNGLQIKGQAMTYVQSHFCNSMIDPDIYLLQILMDHQNLSEHVLCMVLYLIELGLENSAEEESDEENSGTAQVFSLVAERRKKFQEIINRSSSEANQVVRPKTSSKWSAPGSAPQLTTAILEIKESILSLLIKLHHKLSGKQNSYYPPWLDDIEILIQPEIPKYSHGDGITAVERILLKAASQSRMNKRIIEEICRKVTPPVPPKKVTAAEKKTLDKEERRQKARERQQKLLAEFASRQKSFMETAMDVDSPENDIPMEITTAEPQVSEAVYDCVICGQSGPSSEDRPTGLVVLLQASSVLGQCRDNVEPKKLPISEEEQIYPWDTCAAVHDVRLSLLQRYFKDSSCLLAVSIGWEGGVYVQTCGHTLHIDCHKSYMESLRNDQVLQGFSVDKGEFTCPLCRQFANSVLPCYPGSNVENNPWQRPSNKSIQDLIKEVEELQGRPGAFPSETNLSKEMESVMKDIKNTTQKKYRDYSKTPGSPDNDFLFMYSVARTNLELELIHRGGNLCSGGASTAGKRSCLNQLFHVLALHMRLYSIDSEYNPWRKLTQLEEMNPQLGYEEQQPEVPILYHDVTSLLLIQILMMPQPLRKDHFTCIVKVLFTLLYTQALAALSVKCSEEDRSAWKHAGALKKSTCDAEKSYEVLLSFVISELFKGKLYHEEGTQECAMVNPISWSPESMEKCLQDFCLPFLRITSLLQHHLFGEDLPSCQEEEEFSVLASCLGLLPTFYQTEHPFISASCLDWPVPAFDIITQWCFEIKSFTERHAEQGKALLIQESKWKLPHLLQLPENYNTIFQYYHRKTCSVCTKVPKDPAVCLVCGTFVCLKGLCCKQQSYCECVLHSQNCGAGTGIFLLINASVIIIIRGHRFCLWGSVYLDAHGEEDRDLRRGKPLYICKERYKVLEQQWISHTFDHINKRWGPHYNGL
ncbi:UBR3 isoform 2 [Pan troglodytes]|uniref:E3 ubiquitin-protein ligase n=1 Tax=Pan troglodytes TaxID=9598 RepID=A0A2J8PQN5_PANTR|nr:UBR3 isoform 2 [Pan troglodytes]